jgi:L-amino acid N-acyltransferase YncA
MTDVVVRAMQAADWPAVRGIYEQGIATGNATFETHTPDWAEWNAGHLPDHRVVAMLDGVVVGWAALSPVSGRCVYRGVASDSVYIHADARGQGVGRAVLDAVVTRAEAAGIWTVETNIFPENRVSVRLHERCGFLIVGTRKRIGLHYGRWRDTLLLERRSEFV